MARSGHGQKSWNGVAILAQGTAPIETRRGLPGDTNDPRSRYIEAAVNGLIIGCLYLPNGNPAPGDKFTYKLQWFERLNEYAKKLLTSGQPVVLAGDFNVMPTDVYKPERSVGRCSISPRGESGLCETAQTGMDRRDKTATSGRTNLYILGLFSKCLCSQRRLTNSIIYC